MAFRMSPACFISSWSTPSRPAVSTITTECWRRFASLMALFATFTGLPRTFSSSRVTPRSGAKTGTPARSPTTSSWVTALGRCRSAATSSGVWPCALQVVSELARERGLTGALQAREHDDGGARTWRCCKGRALPPRISMSSSWTILTTCCPGLRAPDTSAPTARSRIRSVKVVTTDSATSASRRARRISRTVPSISASVSLPFPRRLRKVAVSRSDRLANTALPSA